MSRHPLFRRAARCWPSAGLLVGGQVACRQVTPGKPGCGLPLRGHRGPGPVRASAHLSQVLVGAGVTPAVHSHGPAPLAPVVAGDRRCAHGRVNSDRAVGRPCSRLIRPQGPHPRTAAWRACPLRSHAVGCCWFSDTQWTASSAAGRFRRLEDSGEDHPAGKYVPNSRSLSGPHPVQRADSAPFGLWVQTPQPVHGSFTVYMTGL